MGIAIPDQIDYLDFGVLWIAGGSNDDVDIMWVKSIQTII